MTSARQPNDKSFNILHQFNSQSTNQLMVENINYLDSLNTAINKAIKHLIGFNVNTIKFLHIKSLHGIEFDTYKFNQDKTTETIQYLRTVPDVIKHLNKNLVKKKSDSLRDEYRMFHNNIIGKIKEFINYYIEYICMLESIRSSVYKKYKEGITDINILISNYNSAVSSLRLDGLPVDPNFHSRHLRLKSSNDLLEDYYNYLDNHINIFNSIRALFKNIDTKFLKML